jgi:signal transduction histidine kinase
MSKKPNCIILSFFLCLNFINHTKIYSQNSDYDKDTSEIKRLLNSTNNASVKDFTLILMVANKALLLAQKHNDKIYIFKCYRKIGFLNEQKNLLIEAKNSYQKALDLLNFVSISAQMDILLDWAIINKQLGQYVVAEEYYKKALELAQNNQDFEMISFSYHGLSTLHSLLNSFDKAVDYNIQALKISQKLGDKKSECIEYRNLSEIYRKSSNIELARKNLNNATDIAKGLNDRFEISICLVFEAKLLLMNNDNDAALAKFKEAYPMVSILDDKRGECDLLINMAETYAKKGMMQEADNCFQKTYLIKHNLSNIELSNYYFKYGIFVSLNKQYDEAISAFNNSLKYAQEGQFKDCIQNANIELYKIYIAKGNAQKSLQHIAVAYAYADSLLKDESNKRIVDAQFKYDVEQNNKKFDAMQKQQERSKILIIVVAFLVLIAILAIFLWLQHGKNRILKEKTAEIEHKNYALEESNEVLLQYAYVSAHDLKEPLRSIGSFVNIIQRKYINLLPPEASEYMNFVTDGVKRMELLLAALLEYSTIASEKIEDVKTASMGKALNDVLQNLSLKITEKEAKINYPSVLPDVKINHLHLIQIFQNLMSNSMKFCENKPIIDFKILHKDDTFIISIKDNGIGMNKDYENKVFKLFQRLDRSKQYEGSGIGLTICKNIVEKYNGTIWFESVEGKGTNFFMAFPKTLIVQGVEKNEVVKSESFT